jgi:predicted ABC-type ATPase
MLENNLSFTYETVMSHKSKMDFMQKAIESGYRVYLYFIATEDPEINLNRVNVRVAQNGHSVAPEIIKSRYFRSLENLKTAVKKTNRAYIFDNSGSAALLIAEITNGVDVSIFDTAKVPSWVAKYLLQ